MKCKVILLLLIMIMSSCDGERSKDANIEESNWVAETEISQADFDTIDTEIDWSDSELPQLIEHVQPEYPKADKLAGTEGTVLLRIFIDREGIPYKVTILNSDATQLMEKAAIKAAKQFVFKPAIQEGNPTKSEVAVPVRFKLNKK